MSQYEIGEEYEIGDDVDALLSGDEYEVGARRALARRSSARPAARPVGGGGTTVRETGFTKSREYPLGFDSGAAGLAAAATAAYNSQPQVLFRPERLVIPGSIAPSFLVNSLTVGKDNMFANANPVPAEVFAPNAVGVRLKLATAQVNSLITISVTNLSGGTLRFMACLIGEAAE